jgi:hypothetical protein
MQQPFTTHSEITKQIVETVVPMDIDDIRREAETSGTYLNILVRAYNVGRRAERRAPVGLVGVGVISFVDQRVCRFLERAEAIVPHPQRLGQ